MAKKKPKPAPSLQRSSHGKPQAQSFYTPFKALDQHFVGMKKKSAPPAAPKPAPPPVADDDQTLFEKAMAGVKPLDHAADSHIAPEPRLKPPARFLAREEMEAYAQLAELVAGDVPFELSYSDEYIDGAIVGLSPRILKKLRNGDFSYQEYIDLHGFNRQDARAAVTEFVQHSFALGLRCILIIPGRGLNSEDKRPVLKEGLVRWLTRSPLKRMVLAFASARAYDGGAGAFYVLLRRNEGREAIVSPAG